MPVVTAIKSGREFSRRRYVGVAVQKMTDLVRVFLGDTSQGEIGESFCGLGIEFRRLFRHHREREENEADAEKLFHSRSNVAQSIARQTCLSADSTDSWSTNRRSLKVRALPREI